MVLFFVTGCEEGVLEEDDRTKGDVVIFSENGDSCDIEEYENDIKFLAKEQAKLLTYPIPRSYLNGAFEGAAIYDSDRHVDMKEYLDSLSQRDSTPEVQDIITEMDSVCEKYEGIVNFYVYLPDGFLEWNGDSAVPVFYVPPYDEYEIDTVYAYDADENEYPFSPLEIPQFVTLGIEGIKRDEYTISSFRLQKVANIQTEEDENMIVIRVHSIILHDSKSPGLDGAPEIRIRVFGYKLLPWGDPILPWTQHKFSSISRYPRSGDDEIHFVPDDDEWDIFEDVDYEESLYKFSNEIHYDGTYRVTLCEPYDISAIETKITKIEVKEIDGGLLFDDDEILEEDVNYTVTLLSDTTMTFENDNIYLKIIINIEKHNETWDPDKFRYD